jgi:hypothetical protein
MNIHFIGKEFENLACLEDFINYEYEPKSNLKYGKRNIYYDDIKQDFINEVNTYGFSPFILESFLEQRDDPNIMRFITKKFNHGLTNYIKVQTKGMNLSSKRNKKKFLAQKSMINLRNNSFNNNNKKQKKKENLISNIFLIKKNDNIKKNEGKDNFLQKALGGVAGYKLNISTEEDKDKEKQKQKSNILENSKNKKKRDSFDENEKNKKNVELLKTILNSGENKIKNKNVNNFNNDKSNLPSLNNDIKYRNLKSFIDKINILSIENQNFNNNYDKKILTLSKNRNILGNTRIFSPISSSSIHKGIEQISSFRKKKKIKNHSLGSANDRTKKTFGINLKNKNKNNFLLFAKARPYRYMGYKETKQI